ncbi:MAG TPA: hypothetical protein VMU16_14495 [Candidatus Binataceae bacterium]|nr:hypothetical protein [Candidatus Binataceae bacterium]
MGVVSSLSRDATLSGLTVAQIAVFVFGFFFLIGWIAEETTKEHRWKKFRTCFVVMAILGVGGEWLADITVFALSEHLQTISDKEVAKLKRDAQQLATDEAASHRAVAEANARAAEAELEIANIERAAKGRGISRKQMAQIVDALRPINAAPSIGIAFVPSVPDSPTFSWGFNWIFARLKWHRESSPSTDPRNISGLLIETASDSSEKDRTAARALVDALRNAGIDVRDVAVRPEMQRLPRFKSKPSIFITIGFKLNPGPRP